MLSDDFDEKYNETLQIWATGCFFAVILMITREGMR